MIDHTKPLALTNPEAARHLALSNHYLLAQDPERAAKYARVPLAVGSPDGAMALMMALQQSRKFDAALEMARMFLAHDVHHTVKRGILEAAKASVFFVGARDGDSREAYALAYELAAHANLNPGLRPWRRESLHGRSLLLSLSQGLAFGGYGDHIMLARFVPYLVALGARIVVQAPPLLARLFATIPGVVSTCGYEEPAACDYAVSLMEVPHILGLSDFPTVNPFVVEPVVFPAQIHNVAITWGASWVAPYMDRSCALAEYMPLMQVPTTTLYAVQKGAHQRQLYPAPVGLEAHDLAPKLGDFLDTAIVLSSMDAVVTTDNVVGNLACSLGLPTFVLVPKCADWRWGERGRAPWYPSARVYQQDVIGEWGAPIARLVNDLSAFLKEHGRPLPTAPVTKGAE